jgi:hypothetical protein
MNIPDYYKPWPDGYSFDEHEPDWFDDLEVTRLIEEQGDDDE